MRSPRNDSSAKAAVRRDHEAGLAAARLGRLINADIPLPPMPHQEGRVTEVVAILAQECGFEQRPVTIDPSQPPLEQVASALSASHIRFRRVTLAPGWQDRNSPILVVETPSGLATIIPGPLLAPQVHRVDADPIPISEKVAQDISPNALEVIRPLPQRNVRLPDLLRISMAGMGRDVSIAFISALLVGIIGLAIPVATNVIFSDIVPTGDSIRLIGVIATLAALIAAVGAFAYVRTYTVIRLMDATESATGGAIIDRLLRLPIGKLRQWSGAEITERLLVWSSVQQALGQVVNTSFFSMIVLVLNSILMVVFIPSLGITAIFMAVVLIAMSWVIIRREKSHLTLELEAATQVNTVALDLMRGWTPIRMSDGEVAGFGRWASHFATYRQMFNNRWKAQSATDLLAVAVLGAMTFGFVVIAFFQPAGSITSGSFLAFLSSFAQFSAGLLGTIATIRALEAIGPTLQRLAPILEIEPELTANREHPGVLTGKIELRNVGFRYSDDLPWVLREVSFAVEPGQFVAIVGTSGSGKSTLMRLLLGFEDPRRGVVMCDDSDLSGLDLNAVRKQFGVVLQSSLMLPGTIRDNVTVASGPLPDSTIWQLLDRVDVGDSIRAMPTGLSTPIDENSTLISGGQRQRILLARALAHDPVILLLDEATSALDNLTQEAVTRNIAELGMTRIVIAHRLSTIRKADLIIVLDQGHVAERGNYDHLMASKGLFSELVARQEI